MNDFAQFGNAIEDVAAANRLLTRAEEDLRKASDPARDPSGSYTALSTVMFMQGRYAEAVVYARRAYDSNVFLRNERLKRCYGLTNREIEVARLLAKRQSNKEIAEQLEVTVYTAGRHTERVMQKLGVGSRRDVRGKLVVDG